MKRPRDTPSQTRLGMPFQARHGDRINYPADKRLSFAHGVLGWAWDCLAYRDRW